MANSPQARKRVRQTARRTAVNRSRVTQYRTYVKKVETAIASGDADAAREAFKIAQPILMSGGEQGYRSQKYGCTQDFAYAPQNSGDRLTILPVFWADRLPAFG